MCSLVCPRADCAHFVVLILRASPCLAHQRSTSSEESPPKTAGTNGSGPRRVQTITRTSRKSTSEYGMDVCVLLHGICGLQTLVQQLRVQIPRRSARGLGRETREGKEKGQAAPSQAYLALRRLWARKTLRDVGPAPRVERNLRSLERLQQRRNPRNDGFQSDRFMPRLWLRNDAVFKLLCRWSQGRSPTARWPMSKSTRIRARTATVRKLPTNSKTWIPHSSASATRQGRWRGCPSER